MTYKEFLKKKLKKFSFLKGKKKKEQRIERFMPVERMFLGKKIFIHDIASFNLGVSELFNSEMYKFPSSRPNPHIVDCGANLGMSIIYFKKLYPKSSIVAFEADEYIFEFLEKNVQSFGYKNVELINKAVWNSEGTSTFFVEGGAGGRLEVDNKKDFYKTVNCTSLKKYLRRQKVDFLKIDIEGAEYEVLKDCEDELKNIDFIFIEYHSFPNKRQNLHKILGIIQKADFKYHLNEAYTTKYPFIKRDLNVGMDLQLNIFCYKN